MEIDLILEFIEQFQTHTMNANTFGMPLNMYDTTYEELDCAKMIGFKTTHFSSGKIGISVECCTLQTQWLLHCQIQRVEC